MADTAGPFDILIVGAGPAGLSAAVAAADAGMRVGLVDDNPQAGGQVWRQGPGFAASGKARALLDRLARSPGVTHFQQARIAQVLPDKKLLAEINGSGAVLAYRRLIIATGAHERFLPFPGWTLPGVTGAGGLQALVKGGLPVTGERVVVAGTGPLLWAAAATVKARGGTVVALVEQAPFPAVAKFAGGLSRLPGKLAQALRLRLDLWRTPYWCGSYVIAARGGDRLHAVTVRRPSGEMVEIACDRLACAYGLVPNSGLAAMLGCRIVTDAGGPAIAVDDRQETSVGGIYAAGECTGVGGMELAALEGRIAALAALGRHEAAAALFPARARYRRFAAAMHEAFALDPALRTLPHADTVLCRCEDVAYGDVAQYASWRDAKLQTRCGMGPCQGKICGDAAAFHFGWGRDDSHGPRLPLAPVRIGTLLKVAEDT